MALPIINHHYSDFSDLDNLGLDTSRDKNYYLEFSPNSAVYVDAVQLYAEGSQPFSNLGHNTFELRRFSWFYSAFRSQPLDIQVPPLSKSFLTCLLE